MRHAPKRWYLVHTKPRQESLAQANLARQHYETYLPLLRQPRRQRGRRVDAIGPMFPRYLFIQLDRETDDWGPIRSTIGVASLVHFGRHAARVPDGLIAALRARENEQGVHVLTLEAHRPGSRVRITDGSFAGYEAVFLAATGRDRVVVLLDILGQHVRTIVSTDVIESL